MSHLRPVVRHLSVFTSQIINQNTHVEGLPGTAWLSAAVTVGAQSSRHSKPLKLL